MTNREAFLAILLSVTLLLVVSLLGSMMQAAHWRLW